MSKLKAYLILIFRAQGLHQGTVSSETLLVLLISCLTFFHSFASSAAIQPIDHRALLILFWLNLSDALLARNRAEIYGALDCPFFLLYLFFHFSSSVFVASLEPKAAAFSNQKRNDS